MTENYIGMKTNIECLLFISCVVNFRLSIEN